MKYIMMFFVLLTFTLPVTVEAHTHLQSSTPEEGGTVSGENPVVTLTFDSPVQEPNALTVTDQQGEEYTIENFTHSPEDTLEFEVPEEVADGEIEFFYSIIGEDGHVMENTLMFNYSGGEETDASEEEEAESATESTDEQQAEDQESDSTSWLLPLIGVGLLVTAGIIYFGARKKS
jgi:copper resistance protein C